MLSFLYKRKFTQEYSKPCAIKFSVEKLKISSTKDECTRKYKRKKLRHITLYLGDNKNNIKILSSLIYFKKGREHTIVPGNKPGFGFGFGPGSRKNRVFRFGFRVWVKIP